MGNDLLSDSLFIVKISGPRGYRDSLPVKSECRLLFPKTGIWFPAPMSELLTSSDIHRYLHYSATYTHIYIILKIQYIVLLKNDFCPCH